MKWLLAGGSGFLGTALRVRLAEAGHEVVRLVRREPATGTEFRWDPDRGELDRAALEGVDVVVGLSGVGIADRLWTRPRRQLLRSSRINPTRTLAEALAQTAGDRPRTLLQASGIAWYGTARTEQPHTEDDPAATDFLAQLVLDWEGATQPAADAGVRVVVLRTSPVLDASGGAFRLMKLAWGFGGGAVLGDGTQRMPMVTLADYLDFVQWAAAQPTASGPYNLTLPQPATNAEFTDTLAEALGRPRVLSVPAPVLRAALGELAEQLVGDMDVLPRRATEQGFAFAAPDVHAAVRVALGRRP